MDIKRTIKMDAILKTARLVNGNIIDENGEIIDLVDVISKVYGTDHEFKLTLTRSTKEDVDLEDLEDFVSNLEEE